MLWEAAALRLVLALGLQREPFQSVHVMMHVILRSRRPTRPRRRQCRQRRRAPALVLCPEQLVPFFRPIAPRARKCELRRTNMTPLIFDHGHHHRAVANRLKRWASLRLHVGLGCFVVVVFWRHKAPWKVVLQCCIARGHQPQRLIRASLRRCRRRRRHRR